MVREKVRIRFRKAGDLRLISHHDLMRCFERVLRRASIPYHSTAGFNPKPRLIFALSLPLGIVGTEEVAELELDEELGPEVVRERLNRSAPPGLEILSARRIDHRTTAHVSRVSYQLPVPAERQDGLAERLAALLASSHCWLERHRPRRRRIDLRPFLVDLRLEANSLVLDLAVTATGTARPEEVLGLLGLGDLLEAGAILERIRVELEDEGASAEPAGAPILEGA
jgi:radical SAM-linked protein